MIINFRGLDYDLSEEEVEELLNKLADGSWVEAAVAGVIRNNYRGVAGKPKPEGFTLLDRLSAKAHDLGVMAASKHGIGDKLKQLTLKGLS